MSPRVDYAALDDAALLARHRATGDGEAFGELVRRHRDRLWAVAMRTLGDREEAADAVQDALVSAFRAGRGGSASAATPRSPRGCTGSSSTPASTGYAGARPPGGPAPPESVEVAARGDDIGRW